MEKLNINLENCYGIKKLDCKFDFVKSNTHSIYAPNGFMKTSFAKTFKDLSNDKESKDLMFPDRKTIRHITDENDNPVAPEQVFVIESYNEGFESKEMSSLIVKKELKDKYDQIHVDLNLKKETLLKRLSQLCGLTHNPETDICKTFNTNNLYSCLEELESEITKAKFDYTKIPYNTIFNQKVINFLETKDFKNKLQEYMKKFNELIDASDYFKKGIFNHNNAITISKNLKDQGFFKAKHTIVLIPKSNSKDSKNEPILSDKQFDILINEEKLKILSNDDLASRFEVIDRAIGKTIDLRKFRNYLENNQEIIPELMNISNFKKKVWISYFNKESKLFQELLEIYKSGKKEIEAIVKLAQKEKTEWEDVIAIFNKRFDVPFKLKITNKKDVILEEATAPTIGFAFKDQNDETNINREELLKVLSSGEKRALYILNIIFEVEARKKKSQKTIFIVDDIADSFDYKNKYAIVEYLQDISKKDIFYEIILTHNFDFFRTLQSRFVKYSNCHMIKKTDTHAQLIKSEYIKNPFNNDWKLHLEDDKKLIASIPFVRNLISYTRKNPDNNPNYITLTSLLHFKSDSLSLTLSTIESIFQEELHDSDLHLTNPDRKVLDVIFKSADDCVTSVECPNLESKIVLSIAIRLKAEQFMVTRINDESLIPNMTENQTGKLFKAYMEKFPDDNNNIEILEQVNLMTPENIHLNSFMYELILDLSEKHLISLYNKVKNM